MSLSNMVFGRFTLIGVSFITLEGMARAKSSGAYTFTMVLNVQPSAIISIVFSPLVLHEMLSLPLPLSFIVASVPALMV